MRETLTTPVFQSSYNRRDCKQMPFLLSRVPSDLSCACVCPGSISTCTYAELASVLFPRLSERPTPCQTLKSCAVGFHQGLTCSDNRAASVPLILFPIPPKSAAFSPGSDRVLAEERKKPTKSAFYLAAPVEKKK